MTTINILNGKTFDQMSSTELQEIASKIVRDDIYCNVNTMVCEMHKMALMNETESDWFDELEKLMVSYDYETPIREHIDNLDICEFRDLLEELDLDEIKEKHHETILAEFLALVDEKDPIEVASWFEDAANDYLVDSDYEQQENETEECYVKRVRNVIKGYFADHDNYSDFVEFINNTLDLDNFTQNMLDGEIYSSIVGEDEFCYENNIEPKQDEIYEHWAISDWLCGRLLEHGYTVETIGCTVIWGRGTTGQAIALDHVIQKIAFDCYSTEVDKDLFDAKQAALKVALNQVKENLRPYVKLAILEEKTAYTLAGDYMTDNGLTGDRDSHKTTLQRNIDKVKNLINDYL